MKHLWNATGSLVCLVMTWVMASMLARIQDMRLAGSYQIEGTILGDLERHCKIGLVTLPIVATILALDTIIQYYRETYRPPEQKV